MRVVRFLDSIKDDADVIYLLGDILDYWYEYRYVVPRGFVRFFGKLAELHDRGIRIVWFIGNHDIWIFDYLPSELGVEIVDGYLDEEIDGKHFLMTHGDGIGKLKPSFKLLRRLFRNRVCQRLLKNAIYRSALRSGRQKPAWQRPMPARVRRFMPSTVRAPTGLRIAARISASVTSSHRQTIFA